MSTFRLAIVALALASAATVAFLIPTKSRSEPKQAALILAPGDSVEFDCPAAGCMVATSTDCLLARRTESRDTKPSACSLGERLQRLETGTRGILAYHATEGPNHSKGYSLVKVTTGPFSGGAFLVEDANLR